MTVAAAFKVNIDFGQVDGLVERLGNLTTDSIAKSTVAAINVTADRVYVMARKGMIADINLSDDYLKRKMSVTQATPGRPVADIAANGDLTPLARFDAKVREVQAKSPISRLKGNKALGLPAGRKQEGVEVTVRRGAPNQGFVPGGFLVPLKNGNGLGLFTRAKGAVNIKHRYGPTVYQLFKYQIGAQGEEILDEFETNLLDYVSRGMEDALK